MLYNSGLFDNNFEIVNDSSKIYFDTEQTSDLVFDDNNVKIYLSKSEIPIKLEKFIFDQEN